MDTPVTTLAIRGDKDLDAYLDKGANPMGIDGADMLGREDLTMPRLELVQAQSQMPEAQQHVGAYYNTLTGEFSSSVTAVLLSLNKGRVAFPRKFARDSEPVCASDDAIAPRTEYQGTVVEDPDMGIEVVIGDSCAACPLSQFGPNGETPLCAKSYAYAMMDENQLPFIIRFQRTATAAAKQINTIIKTMQRTRMITLTSKYVTSDNGNYYIPVVTLAEHTPGDIMQAAFELSSSLGNIVSRAQREEIKTVKQDDNNLPF